jgi:Flp pilus assembly protein TadG
MRRWKQSRFVQELDAGPIVEFAIIVPVLLLLVLGVVEVAVLFNRRNSLVTATREAARFGAVLAQPCSNGNNIRARLNSRLPRNDTIVWANITVVAPGTASGQCTSGAENVEVRVTSDPRLKLFPRFPMLGNINLRASAVFRWERI